jgi:hypothetical protein
MAGSGQVAVEVVGIAHPAEPVEAVSASDAAPNAVSSSWQRASPVVSPAPGIVSSVIGLDRP